METYSVPTRRLRLLRVARGISQSDLASLAGVSQGAVSACERGMTSPLLLEALAAVFGVDPPQRLLDIVDDHLEGIK